MWRYVLLAVRILGFSLLVLLGILIFIPIVLLPASIRFNFKPFYQLTSLWGRLLCWLAGLSINVTYDSPLPVYPAEPTVFVMNHASVLDIPLVEAAIGGYPHIWMSKKSFEWIPFFGFILSRMHVLVDKTSLRAAAATLRTVVTKAQGRALHVFLFPEGGRFSDGKIHDFFSGFAWIARKLNRPVRPVYMADVHKILANGFVHIKNDKPVLLHVGPLFHHDGTLSDNQFAQRVREWFLNKAS